MLLEEGPELGDVGGSAPCAADRVQVDADGRNLKAVERCRDDRYQLRVDRRVVGADRLGTDLPELAQPTLLWSRIPEHRRRVARLERQRRAMEAMLDVGAHDLGGRLGPERQRTPRLVVERVHLFLDDVRPVACGARKESRILEGRKRDRAVPRPCCSQLERANDGLSLRLG